MLRKYFLYISLFLLISATQSIAAGGGPAAFLNYCNSVRNYTLGRTGLTNYSDPSSSMENSALLIESKSSIYLMYTQPFSNFDDISYQSIFYNTKLSDEIGIGVGFGMLAVDNIERRDVIGLPIGFYDSKDMFFSAAAGLKINDSFNVGADLRYIKEEIQNYDRSAITLSFGASYKLLEELKTALTLNNIFSFNNDYKYLEQKENLPLKVSAEFTYLPLSNLKIGVLADIKEYDGDVEFGAGIEYGLTKKFDIRSGYNTRYEEWSAGFGLRFEIGNIDYGLGKNSDLGNTHRFSLTLNL